MKSFSAQPFTQRIILKLASTFPFLSSKKRWFANEMNNFQTSKKDRKSEPIRSLQTFLSPTEEKEKMTPLHIHGVDVFVRLSMKRFFLILFNLEEHPTDKFLFCSSLHLFNNKKH